MPDKGGDGDYQLVGAAVALIAVVGWVVFGWGFDVGDGTVPLLLGLAAAAVAVGVRLTP
ncbi:hypothetical protein [Halorubrum sp. BOL3-1]|uniref:hypothetical protein n=1 Tax=Halorubrum sp. BOL3-1 TaxID=2497325 RepID=UPI00140C6305|nr:hypothetical protein [Halorubrum sp. BOL3-1]